MSDSARPSTRSSKKRSPRRPRRSRKEVKRSKSDDDAEIKHVDPDHGKLNLRDETKLLELISSWKKEEAEIIYLKTLKANHILRLREDLHVKFMMIPHESLLNGRVNERIYYPGYEALLRAMFPEHLGFFVTQEYSPTGALLDHQEREDVNAFYGSIGRIPLSIWAVKPGSWAYAAQKRYEADCQVRTRLQEVVHYLRDVHSDHCPTRLYAVSALGLQVRFYYADVAKPAPDDDSVVIHPPPGPRYSPTLCYTAKQYDYWGLSILDPLSVRTLKNMRDNVHQFAEEVRSKDVPGPAEEQLRATKIFQEHMARHEAALKELKGDPPADFKVIPSSDRVRASASSRSNSPLSSIRTTVDSAIPRKARTVVRSVEDDVFVGKNLIDRDFMRLRMPVPTARVPQYADLFTLLGDMEYEDEEWDPDGETEEDGSEEEAEDEDDEDYKD